MAEVEVVLGRRIEAHGKVFDKVILREPRWADFWSLGAPTEYRRDPDGGIMTITMDNIVLAYVERCLVSPGIDVLEQLNIGETLLVRDAVLGFFSRPAGKTPSPAPGTNSSSEPASGSMPSAT